MYMFMHLVFLFICVSVLNATFIFFYLLKSSVKCKRFVFLIFPMLCGQLGHNQKSFSSEIWKPSLAGFTICVHMSDNRIFFEKIVCTLGCLLMFAYCGFMEHLFILSTLSFLSLLSLLVSIFFWVRDIVTFWLVCLSLDREMVWAILGWGVVQNSCFPCSRNLLFLLWWFLQSYNVQVQLRNQNVLCFNLPNSLLLFSDFQITSSLFHD